MLRLAIDRHGHALRRNINMSNQRRRRRRNCSANGRDNRDRKSK
jgi:hypothetical protein